MTAPPAIPSATNGRVLVVGAAGYIGRFVAEASLSAGHPTYFLVRPGAASPAKATITKALQDKGAIPIHGEINDKQLMEKILKEHEIEIVISAVGAAIILDQLVLVEALKSVKTVKRFLPSEFGHDVDRANPVEPGLQMYIEKRTVRRAIEQSGVPYSYICCNSIASWPYYDNPHPSELPPPLDQFQIYGDGSGKAYFVDGRDIGKFTMLAVNDIRTVNKRVHFRPPTNCYSINDLASLWEKKLGRTLPRVTISGDDLLAAAAENCIPDSIVASFTYDVFINGCQINFSVDGAGDVEVTALYPGETFRSLEDFFEDFLVMIKDKVDDKGTKGLPNNPKSVAETVPTTAVCSLKN